MEKYHRIIKIERIRKELQQGHFAKAYELASTINVNKIKIMGDLGLIAEACFYGKQYRQAKEYYIKVYKATNSRRILSQLVHVSIKLREIETANRYLREFEELAPDDFYRYIYRYQIDRLEGKPLEECIKALEDLRQEEYIDHWAYELAKLYHKTGEAEKCQEECDRIILWFGEGDYVNRAKALKAYYRGELDVTLVGNDAERFSKEIQRILKQEEESGESLPEEKPADAEELEEEKYLIGEEEPEEMEILMDEEDLDEKEDMSKEESLFQEEPSEEDSFLLNISMELASVISDIEEGNQEELSIPKEADGTGEEENHKQIHGPLVSDEAFEQAVYKLLQGKRKEKKEKQTQQEETDQVQKLSKETEEKAEKEQDVQQDGILVYPMRTDDALGLSEDSQLSALMREREVSLSGIFGGFMQVGQVSNQTIKALEFICREKGNQTYFIVTGEPGPGSAELLYAKSMAKMLYRLGIIKSNRIAMIEGDRLNRMDLTSKAYQLKDSCLIIERAGSLEKEAMSSLISLCKNQGGCIAVILEDSRTHMNRLLRVNAELLKLFDTRVNLPKYNNADWKEFVYDYLKGKDYDITLKADGLLTKKIDELIKNRKENMWDAISAIVQEAVNRAEKRNGEILYELSTAGKLDSTKLMVVQEDDF